MVPTMTESNGKKERINYDPESTRTQLKKGGVLSFTRKGENSITDLGLKVISQRNRVTIQVGGEI